MQAKCIHNSAYMCTHSAHFISRLNCHANTRSSPWHRVASSPCACVSVGRGLKSQTVCQVLITAKYLQVFSTFTGHLKGRAINKEWCFCCMKSYLLPFFFFWMKSSCNRTRSPITVNMHFGLVKCPFEILLPCAPVEWFLISVALHYTHLHLVT